MEDRTAFKRVFWVGIAWSGMGVAWSVYYAVVAALA